MAQVVLKDNEIWAKFDIHDVKRLRVGVWGGDIKEVEIQTKTGGIFMTNKEFYFYCLQRMTEGSIFIEIESYPAVGHEINEKYNKIGTS